MTTRTYSVQYNDGEIVIFVRARIARRTGKSRDRARVHRWQSGRGTRLDSVPPDTVTFV